MKVKMQEDLFINIAMKAASKIIGYPLSIERGASLLYQITVDNKLNVTVDPKKPSRGHSAFQTDLCIFEQKEEGIKIPRVVLEFKHGLTTHDIITYSSKARRHKQIYPYLRYGFILGGEEKITQKFFCHNESLDFCVAAKRYKVDKLREIIAKLLRAEIECSRKLEKIAFGNRTCDIFRNEILIEGMIETVV
jgi:hypothetical protein